MASNITGIIVKSPACYGGVWQVHFELTSDFGNSVPFEGHCVSSHNTRDLAMKKAKSTAKKLHVEVVRVDPVDREFHESKKSLDTVLHVANI